MLGVAQSSVIRWGCLRQRTDQVVLDLLDLEQDARLVEMTQCLELVVRIFPNQALNLVVQALGLLILLALALHIYVIIEVIGEHVNLRVLVQAAATDLAHDSRESAGQLLDNEQNHKDADSNGVEDRMNLTEAF